jgi:hypothetical protein
VLVGWELLQEVQVEEGAEELQVKTLMLSV